MSKYIKIYIAQVAINARLREFSSHTSQRLFKSKCRRALTAGGGVRVSLAEGRCGPDGCRSRAAYGFDLLGAQQPPARRADAHRLGCARDFLHPSPLLLYSTIVESAPYQHCTYCNMWALSHSRTSSVFIVFMSCLTR